jgi:uncharacterized membrane protein (DUF4010 family)
MKISKFILIISLLIVVLASIGFFAFSNLWDVRTRGFICLAVFLSGFATAISYVITFSGLEKSIRMFSTFVIGGMVFKMFFAMISLTIIALTVKDLAMTFVLAYFFSYLVFISFEVFALMTKLRPFSKKFEQQSDENQEKP